MYMLQSTKKSKNYIKEDEVGQGSTVFMFVEVAKKNNSSEVFYQAD